MYPVPNVRTISTCFALVLGFSGAAQCEDYLTYTRHSHGWTIDYPADWEVNATDPNFVRFSKPKANALCGVHSGATRWLSIDEVYEFVLAQDGTSASPGGPVNRVIEHERIEAPPSVSGIRVLAVLVPGGTSLRSYFLNSGKIIMVDCETYTSNWRQVSEDYRAVLDSISFEIAQAAIVYDKGMGAFQDGKESKAFQYFLKAAEDGDARAQYSVGIMLYQGRGTELNRDKAMEWLRAAAEQGQLDAQVAFWQISFRTGFLTKFQFDEAFDWLKIAAENGNLDSQFQLAMQFLHGGSMQEKNTEQALRWFLEASRQGDPHSQHEAGKIFLDDSGTLFDTGAAYGWLSIAEENGRRVAAELKEKAASLLSPEERRAIDDSVKRCLETHYRECDF